MDFQRLLILMGLAVTAYMLILAWNEDYGAGGRLTTEGPESVTETLQAPSEAKSSAADIPAIDDLESDIVTDIVPRLEEPVGSLRSLTTEKSRSVDIKTDVLEVQIDLTGGDIIRVALPAYPASLEAPDVPFLLVDPLNKYVAQSGLIGPSGTDSSGSRPLFTTSQYGYDIGSADELRVTLKHTQENAAVILKHFIFHRGDYLIRVEYEIRNLSSEDWRAALFAQIKRDGQQPISFSDNLMGLQPYVGGATRSEDEFYRKLEFDDLEEESYKLVRQQGYMALVQHYFVSAWVPKDDEQINYQARKLPGKDVFLFGFTTPAIKIDPGQEGRLVAHYYVGPKDQYRMREIAEGLDLTVDYGFLWWLSQPLFYLLTVLYSFFSNWGLAIIGLTVIVKTLLYPLSAASFRSMAKMRKLQPEMARLKERYGDDRQKFSQSMMELYKKEGANPLGGCLPILLQMPVFLALYWTLMESVELRQAPFILWIHDLSAMDPYFVLPILMGISMYLTQLMQPEPPDPIQAKVFKFMPIMFTFFFLWFPSGLVLYWLVNNILSIMQQWYVTRQIEKSG